LKTVSRTEISKSGLIRTQAKIKKTIVSFMEISLSPFNIGFISFLFRKLL